MRERYCFWSIATGRYVGRMQRMVDSARGVGVFKDFHVWSDQPIGGAVCHSAKALDPSGELFKLDFLEREVRKLKYDYFVWLDADTWFVRPPGDVLRVLHGAPVHASLECDIGVAQVRRTEWEECSLTNITRIMRFCGVRNRSVFSANSGFWIVHHDVISTFCDLAWSFWEFCKRAGYVFSVEPPLAYATQMLCGNSYLHALRRNADLWATDHAGHFAGKRPDGGTWTFEPPLIGESFEVDPAIVHAPHSMRTMADRSG